MPGHTRTVCMEFFGQARDAIPSIVEVKNYLDGPGRKQGAILAGLEHLDERYLRAVGYATKSKRGDLPKKIGRASCGARVCPYVEHSVGAVRLKKKTPKTNK